MDAAEQGLSDLVEIEIETLDDGFWGIDATQDGEFTEIMGTASWRPDLGGVVVELFEGDAPEAFATITASRSAWRESARAVIIHKLAQG